MGVVTKSRITYFDILNILACFAVLSLHHNGIVHNFNVNTLAWKQSLMFEVLFYWAVPIFFMLTGATLFGYRNKYSTQDFFKKRVLSAIITTRIYHGDIYWFFIPLISLYCFIPVLSLLKDNRDILWYMAIFLFVTHSCLPLLFLSLGIKYNNSLSFPVAGYVLFLILGYLFSTIELSRKQRIVIYLLGLISAFIRYVGTYYYSLEQGKIDKFLFGYIQFHSVLLALAVFVLVKEIGKHVKSVKIANFLAVLSSCSLGIYLIHKLAMSYELYFLQITADNVYWRFAGAFLTYFLCLSVVLVIKRIPYLRVVFP
jgi:surface polysaccharide O-acyltransferase-like enzyme